jgi:hypothetical protein
MGRAAFWANFSQTHLVSLATARFCSIKVGITHSSTSSLFKILIDFFSSLHPTPKVSFKAPIVKGYIVHTVRKNNFYSKKRSTLFVAL